MTILNAHLALARMLGDTFVSPTSAPNTLANGARWTIAMRNDYLYRAMIATLEEIMQAIAHFNSGDAVIALYKMIPNMISYPSLTAVSGVVTFPSPVVKVLSLSANSSLGLPANHVGIPTIPIRILYNPDTITSAILNLRPDVYAVMSGNNTMTISDEKGLLAATPNITAEVIYYPTDPATITGTNVNTTQLNFEEKYINRILHLASMYAWQDSLDLENATALAQTIKPIGVQNATNNTGS